MAGVFLELHGVSHLEALAALPLPEVCEMYERAQKRVHDRATTKELRADWRAYRDHGSRSHQRESSRGANGNPIVLEKTGDISHRPLNGRGARRRALRAVSS